MSIYLGQGSHAKANKILGNLFILNVFIGTIQLIAFYIWLKPILLHFGASEETLPYAYDYMKVLVVGNIITHLYYGLLAMLRSSGYPRLAMYIPIATIILNCILNALFIFVFNMGIFGAAFATILAQVVGLCFELHHFLNKKSFVHFKKDIFKFDFKLARKTLAIGTSPFLMNLLACLVIVFINNALKRISGDISVGAYGIVSRINMLFMMVVIGLTQGMQPIIGYNYGAKRYDRLKSVVRLGSLVSTAVVCVGSFLCIVFPHVIAKMFTSDATLLEVSRQGLQISNIAFSLVGVGIVISNFFQSIGKPLTSIILSLTRQLLFIIPLLIILPQFFEDTLGIWLAIPIADVIAFILAVALMMRQMRAFD
jgi:putative MATE family efflux protein